MAKLLTLYEQSKPKKTGIDSLAYVASTAKIGENVYIAPFAYIGDYAEIGNDVMIHAHATIGEHVKIGNNCVVYPNTTVYHDCRIGNNCTLHAGSVIGADGFGFAPTPDGYEKIPQIGIVILEDNVEIGANTCIDRATMGATIIHKGVKLDNLIQVAHNVEVGENTVMASQVGVAGSTKIGKHCMFGGQVGLAGHIKITDHVNFGAQSGVISDIKEPTTVLGAPAIQAKAFMRSSAIFNRLPDMYRTMGQLQREIAELKKLINKE